MKNFKNIQKNRGMTYVELIVVLAIFAVMSSVIIFNYGVFQAKVDIKNLASDIALQVVAAQKSSVSGALPPLAQQTLMVSPSTWKPSYGVYFSTVSNGIIDNKSFIYFTDLDNTVPPQNGIFNGANCTVECLNKITITKNNYISRIDVLYQGDPVLHSLTDLTVTFSRPNSGAILKSTPAFTPGLTVSYVQISIASPQSAGIAATIKVYPSGRIQVN